MCPPVDLKPIYEARLRMLIELEKAQRKPPSLWEPGSLAFWLDPELWDRTPYNKKIGRLEPCWMYLPKLEPKRDMVIAMVDGELREIERSEWRRLRIERTKVKGLIHLEWLL